MSTTKLFLPPLVDTDDVVLTVTDGRVNVRTCGGDNIKHIHVAIIGDVTLSNVVGSGDEKADNVVTTEPMFDNQAGFDTVLVICGKPKAVAIAFTPSIHFSDSADLRVYNDLVAQGGADLTDPISDEDVTRRRLIDALVNNISIHVQPGTYSDKNVIVIKVTR